MENERQHVNLEKEGLHSLKSLLLQFHELSRREADEATIKPVISRAVSVAQMLMPEVVEKESEEAKIEAYRLPESMLLSPAAFKKIQDERRKYSFLELEVDEPIPEGIELIEELQEMDSDHGRVILAIENSRAVGVTLFGEGENHRYDVSFQYQDGHHPGLGLLMMEELRRKADATQGSVSTFTRKIPLGLGNLGFKYVPKPRDLFNLYYNYDSQEQSDESPIGQEVPAE